MERRADGSLLRFQKENKRRRGEKMWENVVIIIWFSFCLLIGIFFLQLLTLMIEHSDHRELIDALKHLPMHSHCEEDPLDKEGDG